VTLAAPLYNCLPVRSLIAGILSYKSSLCILWPEQGRVHGPTGRGEMLTKFEAHQRQESHYQPCQRLQKKAA